MKDKDGNTVEPYTEEEFCQVVGIGVRTARRLRKHLPCLLTHGRTGRKIWYTEDHVRDYYRRGTTYAEGYVRDADVQESQLPV